MRKLHLSLIAAAAALTAGVALAAERAHVLNVSLPDGSIAQIEYHGDVAPRVVLAPAAIPVADHTFADPFAEMDHVFAAMAAQHEAMLREVAAMQQNLATSPVVQTAGKAPNGMAWHMVSTTTSANGCTQTVEWSATGAQPQVTKASSGNCEAATHPAPAHPAADVAPVAAPVMGHKV